MTVPTATTPGYGIFRGHVACTCLIAWLPAYEDELQRRGIILGPLGIFQLTGTAAASVDTHSQGGAFDVQPLTRAGVHLARQMGADATWLRDTMTPPHTHGVLTGCPHNGPARYQIDEVRAGGDGLVGNAPDPGPRPLSGRTWRQGIEWARTQQEDDMATYAEQLDRIEATGKATAAAITRLDARVKNTNAKLGRANALLRKVRADVKDTATLAEIDALLSEGDD